MCHVPDHTWVCLSALETSAVVNPAMAEVTEPLTRASRAAIERVMLLIWVVTERLSEVLRVLRVAVICVSSANACT